MKSRTIIVALGLMLLAACASQLNMEYDTETDFSGYKHFTWVAPEIRPIANPILDSELLNDRVRNAVREVLSAKGFVEAENCTDFYITYHTASKERLGASPFSVGVGYGYNYRRWRHSALFDGPGVRSYEEGVLILDIISCGTKKLVWRSWDESLVNQRNYSKKAVRRAVEEILAKFPPQT